MSDIDNYLNKLNAPERLELQRIRSLVHKFVPGAEEVITYSMPGFKYKNKYLIAFSVFKDHLGLFPTSEPIAALENKLINYKTSKGGIQFTLDNPLPDSLIQEILSFRVNQIEDKL